MNVDIAVNIGATNIGNAAVEHRDSNRINYSHPGGYDIWLIWRIALLLAQTAAFLKEDGGALILPILGDMSPCHRRI